MNDILKHAGEIRRNLNNFAYESSPEGILFPKMSAVVRGCFTHSVNDEDEQQDTNLITTEGLTYLIDVGIANGTKLASWYVSLFSGNVTVLSTWTAANYVANATEFTNYDEANRPTYTPGTPAAGAVDNLSSRATFTIGVGGGTVRGGALISSNVKSGVAGSLYAAARFAADRTLVEDDVFNVGYTLTLTSS